MTAKRRNRCRYPESGAGNRIPLTGDQDMNAPHGSLNNTRYTRGRFIPCVMTLLVFILIVHAASADVSDPVQLTDVYIERKCLYPSWSPDGERIAYQGNFSLRIMRNDGSEKTRLPVDSPVVHPGWSPAAADQDRKQPSGRGRERGLSDCSDTV